MSESGWGRGKRNFRVDTKGASACVVLLHEVWGLVPHTKDVCKRIGKLGFAALAPNLYQGHDEILTPENIQAAMEGVWELSLEERRDKEKVARALAKKKLGDDVKEVAALLYAPGFRDRLLSLALSAIEEADSRYERVATLGFCLGGGLSLKAAAKSRRLTAAVSYYGEPPDNDLLRKITVPILAVYANHDEIINKKVPGFVEYALEAGKNLTLKIYPRTRHGFFNDTRKAVYNRSAADDSWALTRWFLAKTIG